MSAGWKHQRRQRLKLAALRILGWAVSLAPWAAIGVLLAWRG